MRTWPHHYDSATLILLDPAETGEDARSINVGMSPGDGSYAEPYWYVTPWPPPPEKTILEHLPPLEGKGVVAHTRAGPGRCCPASALVDTNDVQNRRVKCSHSLNLRSTPAGPHSNPSDSEETRRFGAESDSHR